MSRKERIIHLTKSLIKLGWKYTGVKSELYPYIPKKRKKKKTNFKTEGFLYWI